jgi:hypothetical protein
MPPDTGLSEARSSMVVVSKQRHEYASLGFFLSGLGDLGHEAALFRTDAASCQRSPIHCQARGPFEISQAEGGGQPKKMSIRKKVYILF